MKQILLIFLLLPFVKISQAQKYTLKSPSDKLELKVSVANNISFSATMSGQSVLNKAIVSMEISDGKIWGNNSKVSRKETGYKKEIIKPVVAKKYNSIENEFNFLILRFKGLYELEFRAFNDGFAYRWITKQKKAFQVKKEEFYFEYNEGDKIYFPEEESMHSHQERTYKHLLISDIEPGKFCSTGALIELKTGTKVFISESNLLSYPGMFLEKSGTNKNAFKAKFAGYPEQVEQTSDRNVKVTKHAEYLANVEGTRSFPWRLMIVAEDDADLLKSEMVYKLAKPNEILNNSWIKPGKVAWDWWNANNIYGVDFESGINTETYKYYIDFASKYGLDYIILDEGWYYLEDLLKVKETINIKALIDYGKKKNVGIILWVTWKALDDKLEEALDKFQSWGVKGIKVDFMQRDDQWMVDYYEKIAKKAAEHELLVNFHGAYKPTGLSRTYPNILTYEGVKGLEHCKWSDEANPEHNVTLPFTRMVAGPMDYTPGAMLNAGKKNFRIVFTEPMSPTTRCHQLAMYVVFESPLQMLADNPTNYYKEQGCMEFLSQVPTVWDDTKILHAKVAGYVVIARKNADNWYVGGLTDWKERTLEIDFNFLSEGDYELISWQDGINVNNHAADFKKSRKVVTRKTKILVHLAPGGGWAGILKPLNIN